MKGTFNWVKASIFKIVTTIYAKQQYINLHIFATYVTYIVATM